MTQKSRERYWAWMPNGMQPYPVFVISAEVGGNAYIQNGTDGAILGAYPEQSLFLSRAAAIENERLHRERAPQRR